MADPWNFDGESVPLRTPGGLVTLVQGSAFCLSRTSGDIAGGTPQGLFFRDVRILSTFSLRVNGRSPEALAATVTDPFSAAFVARTGTLLVIRHRYIGRGMREDLTIRNFGDEAAFCSVEWRLAA